MARTLKEECERRGWKLHGSVYSGPAKYQWWEYKKRCDRLMAERAAKQKREQAAAA